MKPLNEYITEKKQDVNLENTQMEIDDMKANETNQMPKLNADAIKSIIINNPQMGKVISIVSKKDNEFIVKINKKHYIVDDKISIGYVPQALQVQQDFPATVNEIVMSGCLKKMKWRPFYTKKERDLAHKNMKLLQITSLKNKSG